MSLGIYIVNQYEFPIKNVKLQLMLLIISVVYTVVATFALTSAFDWMFWIHSKLPFFRYLLPVPSFFIVSTTSTSVSVLTGVFFGLNHNSKSEEILLRQDLKLKIASMRLQKK